MSPRPAPAPRLRPYAESDLESALALWRRSWQVAYPEIDFEARAAWWRARWLNELLPVCDVVVATDTRRRLVGFVTLTPATGYLDQIVVAPELWGTGLAARLLDYAKGRAPGLVELHVNQSNARAVAFYRRHGFELVAESVNPLSKMPTFLMRWRA